MKMFEINIYISWSFLLQCSVEIWKLAVFLYVVKKRKCDLLETQRLNDGSVFKDRDWVGIEKTHIYEHKVTLNNETTLYINMGFVY